MPLEILLVLVIGGISAIAILLHLSGRSKRFVMLPEDARAQWHRHFPDDIIVDVTVSRSGHAAIVRTEQGSGLLWSMGADTVGRHLLDYDLIEQTDGFRVIFHDFTAPQVSLRLSNDEQRHWKNMLSRP